MNAMTKLSLYRLHGCWVFDDDAYELIAEAFVEGMSEIITKVIVDKYGVDLYNDGVVITVSAQDFPSRDAKIDWLYEEFGGNWYRLDDDTQMEGWLCPALFHYFDEAPDSIYVSVDKPEAKIIGKSELNPYEE